MVTFLLVLNVIKDEEQMNQSTRRSHATMRAHGSNAPCAVRSTYFWSNCYTLHTNPNPNPYP